MLHELFLALFGYRTSLFQTIEKNISSELKHTDTKPNIKTTESSEEYNSKQNDYKYGNGNDVNFKNIIGTSSSFHPAEIKIISEILKVANYYQKILAFHNETVSNCISDSVTEKDIVINGYYKTTFASALYDETKNYRKEIVELEKDYLENGNLLLTTILLTVSPFYHIFLQLSHLIDVVEEENLHGCKILDFLHKEVILSVGEIQEVLKKLKFSVQKVLLEQLSYWLLYGELFDPHRELFLKLSKKSKKEIKPSEGLSQSQANEVEINASLEVEMVPEFIPLCTAEKILFIGESIVCFEKGGVRGKVASRNVSILKEREKDLLQGFEEVSHHFSLTEFKNLIETVRLCVAEHLYSLVIEAGLVQELNCVRDIFLLGRGELYQAFFILSENKRPSVTNINALFQRAGRQVMMKENLLDKFVVTYDEPNSTNDKASVWKNIRIEYLVEWPLHKFFDSSVQEKYNSILRFLLKIRQAQLRLQYLWVSQKENKAFKSDNLGLLCWTLRHHMSLLIFNLQYYIQVDVLETCFGELEKEINTIKDYQRLCFLHQAFLSSVTTQCFLSHPLISSSISSILGKINDFCNLLESSPSSSLRSEIVSLKEDFDRASGKFFWILKTLVQSKNCQHTAQLVLRIDYNQFYNKKNPFLKDVQ